MFGGNVSSFSWSPDGSHLAYLADALSDDVTELFTVALASPAAAQRMTPQLTPGGNISAFTWSTDGFGLIYVGDQDQYQMFELYSVSLLSSDITRLSGPLVDGGDVLRAAAGPTVFFNP